MASGSRPLPPTFAYPTSIAFESDAIIRALIFAGIVGRGPQAGSLAIASSNTGTLAKLLAEAVETIDEDQVGGAKASGGSKLEAIRFAILHRIGPLFLSPTLYVFKSKVRSAPTPGSVGAGGIGRLSSGRILLSERLQGNYWEEFACIILAILIAVAIVDTLFCLLRLHRVAKTGTG